jgi:hypothetical protein
MYGRVLARIAQAEMFRDPFDHFVATEVFDDHVYRTILENLPSRAESENLKQFSRRIHPSRSIVDLGMLNSEFWYRFERTFGSPWFADQVLGKFGQRLGETNYITTELVQDKLGYAIGPHTDERAKRLTLLFYLAPDHGLGRFGTSICRALDPSLVGNPEHHAWDRFAESHLILFKPNVLLGFCRTDDSFHAVRPIDEDVTRNSICVTIRNR